VQYPVSQSRRSRGGKPFPTVDSGQFDHEGTVLFAVGVSYGSASLSK